MGLHDVKTINKGTRSFQATYWHIPDEDWPFRTKNLETGKWETREEREYTKTKDTRKKKDTEAPKRKGKNERIQRKRG